MSDIAATLDGTDIDFSVEPVAGLRELRQAAVSRLSNDVTMTNADYGIDLAAELGRTDTAATLGIRATSAILNDDRFADAVPSRIVRSVANGTETISLAFDIVAIDGTELSLEVLVADGRVVLVP